MTAAALLVAAQGAMAQTVSPEGIGIEATGILVNVPPTPDATAANPHPASVVTVPLGALLTAHAVNANVNGNTTTAGVASLTALGSGPAAISAGALNSTCTANSDGSFTLASTVASLSIGGTNIPVQTAPNSTVTVPLVGSVTFNKQVAGPTPGSMTVDALVINLTLLHETITVGSSTCGPYAASTPVAGGKGLVLGLGALGAGTIGVAAVRLNRRRGATNA